MVRRKQPVLIGLQKVFPKARFFHLDRTDLDYIVETLNWKPQGGLSLYGEPLRRLMERLKGCGGNLRKMMDGDPELAKVVSEACVTCWTPSETGRAHLHLVAAQKHLEVTPGQVDRMRPERVAALLFHVGTLNPEWEKLAGPCARCGMYYLKSRASQNVYCSQKCGNRATAAVRTRKRIEDERKDKVKRVQAAVKEWKRAKPQPSWKRWVSEKTGIDQRFLTRNFTEAGAVKPTPKEK